MLVDFQKKHGLTPDGKFGHITAKKIVEVFNIKHPAIFFGQVCRNSENKNGNDTDVVTIFILQRDIMLHNF